MPLTQLETQVVHAPDGRTLEVMAAAGEGTPVFILHGTPDAAGVFPPALAEAAERGVRMVSYSRPGYGGSTRHEGRSVADCAADVAAVADALGADRFHVTGGSGGGPHALASAALLGDRVLSASTVAGVAPAEAEGLDWVAGMGPENVEEFEAAVAGQAALAEVLKAWAPAMREATGDSISEAVPAGLLCEADRRALTGDLADHLAASGRHGLADGIAGWLDDDLAFVAPWGFDLAAIAAPVTVWHGVEDRFVPVAHGRWLGAHLPGADVRILDGHGHLSLVSAFGEVLDDLLAAARTG